MSTTTTGFFRARWYMLLALALLLLAGVFLLRQLPAWRVDLTEDKLFTLTKGTHAILDNLATPVELKFYFSDQATRELPQLRDYAQRVKELLVEYQSFAGGNLNLQVVDPEPFSEQEDDATQAGLQSVPGGVGGDAIFLGLVGSNNDGDQEVITFFNPERERFLEYDVSQLIYRLSHPKRTVVGVITDAQMFGGFDFATQRSSSPWFVIQQLQQLAEVRQLEADPKVIDDDVDVLMVVHPRELSEQTLYAIDQYVLAGGKAMLFVDPHAELIAATSGMMAMPGANSSDLPRLFKAWGIVYDPGLVAADARWALRLAAGEQRLQLPHVGIIGVGAASLNREDITTAELETINFATPGFFSSASDEKEGGDKITAAVLEPLVSTSDKAMPMPVDKFINLSNHGDLLRGFSPTGEVYNIAARVRGVVPSAFPDGPPQTDTEQAEPAVDSESVDAEAVPQAADPEAEANVTAPHLARSQGDINVILVADTDMLTDRLWVQISNFFGQSVAAPWANNGDFVSNAVESLAGSSELTSIRSRGTYERPFEVVRDLELAAAERFQAQEQVLVKKLDELEQRIQALSKDQEGQIILELNPEQQQEIKSFEQEKLRIRKELRQVQHQLNQDIESLETRLKIYNILFVPGLLTVLVIGLAALRARRRSGLRQE